MQAKNIIIFSIISLLPILYGCMKSMYMLGQEITVGVFLVLCCLFFIISLGLKKDQDISIQVSDFIVFIFFMHGSVHTLIFSEYVNEYVYYKWLAILLTYVLVKGLSTKVIVIYSIAGAGFIQSLLGLLQLFKVIPSLHGYFGMTGSFGNPAQLACVLSISVPAWIWIIISFGNWKRTAACVALASTLITLYLTDSRAAIIASLIGVAVLFIKRISFSPKSILLVVLPICCIIGFLGFQAYKYKQDSADGRILIWKVCCDMIKEKPVTGHGVNSFPNKYMLYQAEYFQKNPSNHFEKYADNIIYPYNEFLHLFIEQGILSTIIILILLGYLLISKELYSGQRCFKSMLVTLLIFSLFSYPADIFPLMFLFPLMIGSIDTACLAIFKRPKAFNYIIYIITTIVISNAVLHINQNITYSKQAKLFTPLNQIEPLVKFYNNFDKLRYNTTLRQYFSIYLEKHPNEELLLKMPPSYDDCMSLGMLYYDDKNFESTILYFKRASYMIPSRLSPQYWLWKTYVDHNRVSEAVNTAQVINNKPIKVENTATIRMRAEVQEYLKNTKTKY